MAKNRMSSVITTVFVCLIPGVISADCVDIATSEGPATLKHGQTACAPLKNGETAVADKGKRFVTCSYGVVLTQFCPPGLRFDTTSGTCIWPQMAACKLTPAPTEGTHVAHSAKKSTSASPYITAEQLPKYPTTSAATQSNTSVIADETLRQILNESLMTVTNYENYTTDYGVSEYNTSRPTAINTAVEDKVIFTDNTTKENGDLTSASTENKTWPNTANSSASAAFIDSASTSTDSGTEYATNTTSGPLTDLAIAPSDMGSQNSTIQVSPAIRK